MADGSIAVILRQQGREPTLKGNPDTLLVPLRADRDGFRVSDRFYKLFRRASFRKMLNRLCRAKGASVPLATFGDDSKGTMREYFAFLRASGIVDGDADGIRLRRHVDNIGPTLEWYVAEVFKQEFNTLAGWSVYLADIPAYGDYDVLAWSLNTLIYVETKAKSPKEIGETELKHFLQRVEELQPEMAVLLVDTDGDIADVLIRLQAVVDPLTPAASGITDLEWRRQEPLFQPQPRHPTVNFGYARIYIVNTKKPIIQQLRSCLRLYHTRVKHMDFWGGPYINFITSRVGDDLQE